MKAFTMRMILFALVVPLCAFAQAPNLDSTYTPAHVRISTAAPQSLTIEWDKVRGATAYRVWYGLSADNLDYAGDTPFTQFEKTHLMEGAKYYFAVSAVVDTQESPRSAPLLCSLPSEGGQANPMSAVNSTPAPAATPVPATPPPARDSGQQNSVASTPQPAVAVADTVGKQSLAPAMQPSPAANVPATDSPITQSQRTFQPAADQPTRSASADSMVAFNRTMLGAPKPAVNSQAPAKPAEEANASPLPPEPASVAAPSTADLAAVLRNYYTVQIEASVNNALVENDLRALQAKGVKCRIERFSNQGALWYRLRAGAFASRKAAESFRQSLLWTKKEFHIAGPAVFYNDRMIK